LAGVEMLTLVGGGCGSKCQNICQAGMACGTCQNYQGEGENCPGGGGGMGTAFTCVSTADDVVCTAPRYAQNSQCRPAKVCRCDASSPPACKEYNVSMQFTGASACEDDSCT
jgi:hypothetical protein